MVDSKKVKPICCENCGFPFDFAESGYAPQADCPACGFQVAVDRCPVSSDSKPDSSGEPQRELFQIGVTQEDLQKCRSKNCPRMKRESMSPGSPKNACEMQGRCPVATKPAPTAKAGSAGEAKDRPHRGVLLLSVAMQVLLLLLTGFVVLKTYPGHHDTAETSTHRRQHRQESRMSAPPFAGAKAEPETTVEADKKEAARKEAERLAAIAKAEAEKKEAARLAATVEAEAVKKEAERLAAAKAEAEKKVGARKELKRPAVEAVPAMPETAEAAFRPAPVPVSPKESRSAAAQAMLETAMAVLADNPEKSLEDTLHAIRMFEEIPRPVPSISYWLLGQAYAALSWGKAFLVDWPVIEEMSVSPDGHWLMTRRQDGDVRVWDVVREQEQRHGVPLNPEGDRFVRLLFTPDMRLIVGGQENGTIRIWDIPSKKTPTESSLLLRETVPGLAGLAVSPDGRWLVAYGNPSAGPRISRNNHYLRSLPLVESVETILTSLKNISSDLKKPGTLVVANERNVSGVIPIETIVSSRPSARQVTYLVSETSPGRTGASPTRAAPAGKVASEKTKDDFSPLDESVVLLWDLKRLHSGTVPAALSLRGHKGSVHALGFDKDSNLLAVGGADTTTRVYDLRQKDPATSATILQGHRLDVTALVFAPGGRWIATGSRDNTVRLWSLDSSSAGSVVLEGHLGWITSLRVDPKGNRLFSGSYDKTIRIWDVHPTQIDIAVQKPPLVLQNDQGVVRELRLTADGSVLISRGDDGSLRIRDLDGDIDNRHSVMFRNRMLPITQFVVTPDDRWLIFSYANRRTPAAAGVRLWPLGFEQLVKIVNNE